MYWYDLQSNVCTIFAFISSFANTFYNIQSYSSTCTYLFLSLKKPMVVVVQICIFNITSVPLQCTYLLYSLQTITVHIFFMVFNFILVPVQCTYLLYSIQTITVHICFLALNFISVPVLKLSLNL